MNCLCTSRHLNHVMSHLGTTLSPHTSTPQGASPWCREHLHDACCQQLLHRICAQQRNKRAALWTQGQFSLQGAKTPWCDQSFAPKVDFLISILLLTAADLSYCCCCWWHECELLKLFKARLWGNIACVASPRFSRIPTFSIHKRRSVLRLNPLP